MLIRVDANRALDREALRRERFRPVAGRYLVRIDGRCIGRSPESQEARPDDVCSVVARNYPDGMEKVYASIDGAFRIVLCDTEKDEIAVLTDPHGLERVFYVWDPEAGLTLSDNLPEVLQRHPEKSLDPKALAEYLRFLDISAPYTIYKGIFCLEPQSLLVYSARTGRLTVKALPLTTSNGLEPPATLDDAVEEFEARLFRSIEKRATGSGKLGLLLSGGIDSSLLASGLSRLRSKAAMPECVAYTVGFDEPGFDESKVAEGIAGHLGLAHRILRFSLEEEIAGFREFIDRLEIPFADPAAIPTVLALERMRDDSVDTVMEGTGADGLIGYMLSRYHAIVLRYTSRIPYPLRRWTANVLEAVRDPLDLRPFFDFSDPEEKFIRWKGWTKEELRRLLGIEVSLDHTAFYRAYARYKDRGIYELYRRLLIAMPDYRITEMPRHFGLTPAFPFLDRNVRDYVEGLPLRFKYHQGTGKVLYRKTLGRYVPEALWNVPKHGFDYPFERLMRHDDHTLVRAFLNEETLGLHGLFDRGIVRSYVDRYIQGDASLKFKIWALVVFQSWYLKQRFGETRV